MEGTSLPQSNCTHFSVTLRRVLELFILTAYPTGKHLQAPVPEPRIGTVFPFSLNDTTPLWEYWMDIVAFSACLSEYRTFVL